MTLLKIISFGTVKQVLFEKQPGHAGKDRSDNGKHGQYSWQVFQECLYIDEYIIPEFRAFVSIKQPESPQHGQKHNGRRFMVEGIKKRDQKKQQNEFSHPEQPAGFDGFQHGVPPWQKIQLEKIIYSVTTCRVGQERNAHFAGLNFKTAVKPAGQNCVLPGWKLKYQDAARKR
jgi:hypothetical protein